jgi:hypothetical protein
MHEPWLRRDHSGLWRLPEPLPPARWPRMLLGLLAGVILVAVALPDANLWEVSFADVLTEFECRGRR